MCMVLHKLFKCGCKEAKSIDLCPMIDQAIDLVDLCGVPETDARIVRLHDHCGAKSAARYELQSGMCARCSATIDTVGLEAWRSARERDEAYSSSDDMDDAEVPAAARRPSSMGLDGRGGDSAEGRGGGAGVRGDGDEDDECASTTSVDTARPALLHSASGEDVMRFLVEEDEDGTSAGVDAALAAVLAAREDLADFYGNVNIYDDDDDDDDRGKAVGHIDGTEARASRSAAPSPSREPGGVGGGLGISFSGKRGD